MKFQKNKKRLFFKNNTIKSSEYLIKNNLKKTNKRNIQIIIIYKNSEIKFENHFLKK
jgi:hypothetical protein